MRHMRPRPFAGYNRVLRPADTQTAHVDAEIAAAAGIAGNLDLYLLLGQSNMVGNTESGSYFGPDPEIATGLQAATVGATVVTLNAAVGGSFMQWWMPSTDAFGDFSGNIRQNLIVEACDAADKVVNSTGVNATVKGAFFYQGESDVLLCDLYSTNQYITQWTEGVQDIIAFLRGRYGNIPFVYAQIATYGDPDVTLQAYWSEMQTAQANVLASLTNADMVTTSDLARHDISHLSDASQATLGTRFANAMVPLL